MTFQPIPSEFPYIWGKFRFLYYQCTTCGYLYLFPLSRSTSARIWPFSQMFSKKNETLPKSSNSPLFQEIVGCDGKVKKLKPGECEDICVDQATYTNEYQVYRYNQKNGENALFGVFSSFFCTYHLYNPEWKGRDNNDSVDAMQIFLFSSKVGQIWYPSSFLVLRM